MGKYLKRVHKTRLRLITTTLILLVFSSNYAFGALPDSITSYIKDHQIKKTYILGDLNVIDDSVRACFPNTFRVAGSNGSDAYARNNQLVWTSSVIDFDEGNQRIPDISTKLDIDYSKIYFSTGEDYPDAIAGAALAAKTKSPIIIIPKTSNAFLLEMIGKINFRTNPNNYTEFMNPGSTVTKIDEIIILGGTGAVTESAENILKDKCEFSPKISRIYGNNRYDTATAISKSGWDKSDYAVLVTGNNYPDALASSTLAARYNAPILLTGKDHLEATTKEELLRLEVVQVYIVGGTGVISSDVQDEIISMGIGVNRIGGKDRYETSVKLAIESADTALTGVFVINGSNFQDALTASPLAAANGMPLVLVPKSID